MHGLLENHCWSKLRYGTSALATQLLFFYYARGYIH